MNERRGKTLKVLCILSFIWIAWTLLGVTRSMIDGPKTAEELREDKLKVLSAVQVEGELDEQTKQIVEEGILYGEIENANFNAIQWVTLISALVGLLGVLMMYKLRRMGFFVYLAYIAALLILQGYFFGGMFMGIVMLFLKGGIDTAMVVLYANQLKRMD